MLFIDFIDFVDFINFIDFINISESISVLVPIKNYQKVNIGFGAQNNLSENQYTPSSIDNTRRRTHMYPFSDASPSSTITQSNPGSVSSTPSAMSTPVPKLRLEDPLIPDKK